MLCDDCDTTLSSGLLKNPLASLLASADDEYTFEHKEYLISVEKEAFQPSSDVPPPKPSYKRPAPSAPRGEEEELVKPRSKEEQKDVDVMAMLQPRKVPSNSLSAPVDDLLSLLAPFHSTPNGGINLSREASSHKYRDSEDSLHSPSVSSSLPHLLSIPPVSNVPETTTNREETTLHADALDLSLPPFSDISSHNLVFFSPPPLDTSSVAAYAHSTRLLLQAVLRSVLFTASQRSLPPTLLTCSLFDRYTAQGHTPAPTDVIPPLAWLAEAATSFQSPSLTIWTDCTLHVKREEWLPAKRKKVAVEPRFFLTAPTLAASKKAAKEDAGSLLNALLAVLTPSRAVFFRSLWHGCTTNHMLEIAPISGVDESSFPDQSHLVVLQCGSVFSPSLLHSRSTWK